MNIAQFIFAGNARFTIENPNTGNRFTYWVRKAKDRENFYFVRVLTGPDNTSDYSYLGTIDGRHYKHGWKSRIKPTAPSSRAINWLMVHLDNLGLVKVHHEGRCGRCGRVLTVPESIITGFGPECAGKV